MRRFFRPTFRRRSSTPRPTGGTAHSSTAAAWTSRSSCAPAFCLPVVPDSVPDHPGPLAGVLAALNWTADHRPDVEWVVSVSGDCPFLPRDLVRRFHEAVSKERSQLAVAASAGQVHPVIGLWRVDLRQDLQHAVLVEEMRKIDRWTSRYRTATVCWPAEPVDPFFNANTLEDLAEAERLARLAVH